MLSKMQMDEIVEINKKIVIVEILIFIIVGVFGNFNLIWATLRKKDMRSKPGILLVATAGCHIVCLLSELVNIKFLIQGLPIIRSTCMPYLIPYMFAISAQAVLMLTMALDILFAILLPAKYMRRQIIEYVIVACIPALMYGLFIMWCAIWYADDEEIPFCNPPLVLIPTYRRVWSLSNIVINSSVVIVYVLLIAIVKFRTGGGVRSEQRRAIRRLQVVAIVFVFSWYIALLGVDIGVIFPENIRPFWQSNMIFFALICYSQTFFVCFWRSMEYRKLFCQQMKWMGIPCGWLAPAPGQVTCDSKTRPMELSQVKRGQVSAMG